MKMRILVSVLPALLAATEVSAAIPYERTENRLGVTVGARKRTVADTMLFSEALVKYGQFQNYLHFWIDRPLFWDRALRPGKFAYETQESFAVHLREARRYGMNGLGIFGTYGGRLQSFVDSLAWAEGSRLEGVQILPIAFYAESGHDYTPDPKEYVDIIRVAQASPYTPRVNGKVLIATYNYRMFGLDMHRRLHAQIRAGVGNGDYLLMGDLEMRTKARLMRSFRENGRLSNDERKELEKLVTDTLDVADGLHLGTGEYRRDPCGPYCSHFDLSFLKECLTPVLNDVYARPQYAGKLLGFYIIQGYINHMSGMNHGEFGTSTLRNTMAAALALNPDYLVFFEWNEVNENTMFQPTVYSGQTIGRLVRYYANLMRGRKQETYPGDDPDVPDIVLSHHVTFKPGEKLEFEILNVPAGEKASAHEVQLQLWDAAGEKLLDLPKERLSTSTLGSVTYAVPGESFAPGSSVVPILMVDGVRYRGFHPIRCDATSCRNYKEVRGSLRDLFMPEKRTFGVKRTAPGEYEFRADLAFGERLASVELVADEDEVAAYDVSNEYDTASCDIIRLAFTMRPGKGGSKPIGVRLIDAEGTSLSQQWMANVNPDVIVPTGENAFRLYAFYWSLETPYYAAIPKSRSAKARIELDASAAWDGRTVTVPVATVLERGSWAAVLADENGFRVDVTRVDNLPDVPYRPGVSAISWRGRVRSDDPMPSFHLRAISERGRIWRSAPILPAAGTPSGPSVTVDSYGEWKKCRCRTSVPSALVPDIEYVFSPTCGAAVANSCHPKFNATLGGGFHDAGAMSEGRALQGMYGGSFDPKWTRLEDGSWGLRFDGVDDYVGLPIEAFPLNAFTFETEFRPHYGERTMVLFRHSALWRASLCLFIRGGRLYAMWGDRDLDDPQRHTARFDTGLEIRNGDWNALKVKYDFQTISFTVNGRSKSYPFDRRGYVFRPAIFGGHVVTSDISPDRELDWFKGDLRKLAIRHCAE